MYKIKLFCNNWYIDLWELQWLKVGMTPQNMMTSHSLLLNCHLSNLKQVGIHIHDGKFVFQCSRIYFRIKCHKSFLHTFEDSLHQKKPGLHSDNMKTLIWLFIQVEISKVKKYLNNIFFIVLLLKKAYSSLNFSMKNANI